MVGTFPALLVKLVRTNPNSLLDFAEASIQLAEERLPCGWRVKSVLLNFLRVEPRSDPLQPLISSDGTRADGQTHGYCEGLLCIG